VGLAFQGTHDRGIDDARNIARLLPYALGRKPIHDEGLVLWSQARDILPDLLQNAKLRRNGPDVLRASAIFV
jgi:hypothetical protein